MSRPTKKNAKLTDELVLWVSEGKTLADFCRKHELGRRTVYDWLEADAGLSARFARARDLGADAIADEILRIADDGLNDTYVDDEGKPRTDNDVIQRSKLRVETRLKLLAKWFPQRYGDKLQVGGAADLPALQLTHEQRAERINAILSTARNRPALETDHGTEQGDPRPARRSARPARRKKGGG